MPSKYVLEQELGAGGMGRVYRARLVGEAGFERPVVMKKLLDAKRAAIAERFPETVLESVADFMVPLGEHEK